MKALSVLLLILTLLIFAKPARADVAPPAMPPGANLVPGVEVTQVRMLAEQVLIEVKKDVSESLGQRL
jgi:hypothetical protein